MTETRRSPLGGGGDKCPGRVDDTTGGRCDRSQTELSEMHGVKGKLYRQLSKQKKYQKLSNT